MTMLGKTHSEETKRKQSDSKKGRRFTPAHKAALSAAKKGKPCPTRGVPRPGSSSELHHNWKGGDAWLICKQCDGIFTVGHYRKDKAKYCCIKCKTDDNRGLTKANERVRKSKKYKEWRKAVFERDNYTCQMCNVRGGTINADHIKPFALFQDLRFDISNGRTLCNTCHKQTDTFGRLTIYRHSNHLAVTNNI